LGSNWDYRLMFLLLTIPLLASLAQQDDGAFSIAAQFLPVAILPGLVVATARFDKTRAAAQA
jgi:hypothetical protein